ncbi:MAG: LPS assembly lipoprotein LptE [Planctomycetota bacterium]
MKRERRSLAGVPGRSREPAGSRRVRGVGRAAYSACLSAALACGCGYTLGYRAPPGVETVAVPIFQNSTFPLRRDVEYEITSRFREELQARTPLRLVDSGSADLVILGTVRQYRDPTVAEGPRDERIESVLIVAVDLVVEDYVNGVRSEVGVEVVEPFSDQRGETARDVRARAFKNLAERMAIAVEAWEGEPREGSGPAGAPPSPAAGGAGAERTVDGG